MEGKSGSHCSVLCTACSPCCQGSSVDAASTATLTAGKATLALGGSARGVLRRGRCRRLLRFHLQRGGRRRVVDGRGRIQHLVVSCSS
jgi:hypothetical protein